MPAGGTSTRCPAKRVPLFDGTIHRTVAGGRLRGSRPLCVAEEVAPRGKGGRKRGIRGLLGGFPSGRILRPARRGVITFRQRAAKADVSALSYMQQAVAPHDMACAVSDGHYGLLARLLGLLILVA